MSQGAKYLEAAGALFAPTELRDTQSQRDLLPADARAERYPHDSQTPARAERFPTIAEERWLGNRLGIELFHNIGTSTPVIRRELVRAAILALPSRGEEYAGKRDGKPETLGSLFERLYRQPLEVQP